MSNDQPATMEDVDRLTMLPAELFDMVTEALDNEDSLALRETCTSAQQAVEPEFKKRYVNFLIIQIYTDRPDELENILNLLCRDGIATAVKKVKLVYLAPTSDSSKYHSKTIAKILSKVPTRLEIEIDSKDSIGLGGDGTLPAPIDGVIQALAKSSQQITSLKVSNVLLGNYHLKALFAVPKPYLRGLDLQDVTLQYGSWGVVLRPFVDGVLDSFYFFNLEVATDAGEPWYFMKRMVANSWVNNSGENVGTTKLGAGMADFKGAQAVRKGMKHICKEKKR